MKCSLASVRWHSYVDNCPHMGQVIWVTINSKPRTSGWKPPATFLAAAQRVNIARTYGVSRTRDGYVPPVVCRCANQRLLPNDCAWSWHATDSIYTALPHTCLDSFTFTSSWTRIPPPRPFLRRLLRELFTYSGLHVLSHWRMRAAYIGRLTFISMLLWLVRPRFPPLWLAFDASLWAALVVYEYINTVDQEIVLIWRRKWTSATWIFVINRYSLLLLNIMSMTPVSSNMVNPYPITLFYANIKILYYLTGVCHLNSFAF